VSIDKPLLSLVFSGDVGLPLTITVTTKETLSLTSASTENTFVVQSTGLLTSNNKTPLEQVAIDKRFKNLDNAAFSLQPLDIKNLAANVGISFKTLTLLKSEVARVLNGGQKILPEVILPKLEQHAKQRPKKANARANLSLLICDEADVNLGDVTDADIYFKLPDAYKRGCTKYVDFLLDNPRLIPWFPSVLIDKDYDVALNILEQVKPELIVTSNTGIANRAYELGIKWIAGPNLNTTNSYALLAMQEALNCSGAFISNEINKQQIRGITRPKNFKMLYSIYHPILLMVSRQCFFQQSVGCEKPRIDNGCMLSCDKSTSITNLKGVSFAIDKQKAGYPSIYNQDQFLNTEIIDDLADVFDDFMIDLTNIGAGDKQSPDKALLIAQFEQLLSNDSTTDSELSLMVNEKLKLMVPENTNGQYHNGL
jgi:putative protease